MKRAVATARAGPGRPARGVALIVVLWVVALLSSVALTLAAAARMETLLAGQRLEELRSRQAAEGALELTVLDLLFPLGSGARPTDGTPFVLEVGDSQVRVRVFDEAGKVDLNMAGPDLLSGLFRAAGATPELAAALADAVMDWRDADRLRRLNGAEDADYAAAGLDHGAKDARFENVGELRMVLGMTPEIFASVREAVTVYHRHAWVNPAVASRPVLLAMPGMDPDRVDAYLEARAQAPAQASALLGVERTGVQVRGTTYTIQASPLRGGQPLNGLEVTLRLNRGNADRPYQLLQWDRFS